MKVLVTGATGFLGYRTIEHLLECNTATSIIATGRTLKSTHQHHDEKVQYILGDLSNPDFVKTIVEGVEAVVHCAALSSPWGDFQTFYNINVKAQSVLLDALDTQVCKRFVMISSPSIYFNGKHRLGIKESEALPVKAINHYAHTKVLAERMLAKYEIPYIILRPRALIGRGDTVIMPRVLRAYEDGRLKIIGNGKNKVDLTAVKNVAEAIRLSLIADEKALNQAYNVSNDEVVDLWTKIRKVIKALDGELSHKKVPYFIVKLLAQWMEWKARRNKGAEPVLTVYGVGTLAKSFTLDISKAKELLNYNSIQSVDEAIEEFVQWYKSVK